MVRTQAKDQNPRSTKDSRNRMGTMEYMQLKIANVYQMTNRQSNMECLTNPFGKRPFYHATETKRTNEDLHGGMYAR